MRDLSFVRGYKYALHSRYALGIEALSFVERLRGFAVHGNTKHTCEEIVVVMWAPCDCPAGSLVCSQLSYGMDHQTPLFRAEGRQHVTRGLQVPHTHHTCMERVIKHNAWFVSDLLGVLSDKVATCIRGLRENTHHLRIHLLFLRIRVQATSQGTDTGQNPTNQMSRFLKVLV